MWKTLRERRELLGENICKRHNLWSTSVQFSRSVVSHSLRRHELQHTRPPCPSPSPGVHSDSRPSSQWCHPAISSSVVSFSCPQSLPASGSFPMSQLFTWGGQSIGVSALASVLPVNTQDWSPLGWTSFEVVMTKCFDILIETRMWFVLLTEITSTANTTVVCCLSL